MKKSGTSDVVDDMWINTQADIDDIDHSTYPHRAPTDWEQTQQENIILNPDPDSMESRG